MSGYSVIAQSILHPPSNLLLCFICQLRLRLSVTFAVLGTDGGGEIWSSKVLQEQLIKEGQCTMEPTGAYSLAANGLVKRGIGILCVHSVCPSTNMFACLGIGSNLLVLCFEPCSHVM
jgi:hypothetical protein